MRVKEVYEYAIEHEEHLIAHYLLYAIQNGVPIDEDIKNLSQYNLDTNEARKLAESNVLGFTDIKIFSLKKTEKEYVFIFAEDTESAKKHFFKLYHTKPINCHEYPLDTLMARGNEFITFRDIRKEHDQFPALCGVYFKAIGGALDETRTRT